MVFSLAYAKVKTCVQYGLNITVNGLKSKCKRPIWSLRASQKFSQIDKIIMTLNASRFQNIHKRLFRTVAACSYGCHNRNVLSYERLVSQNVTIVL